MFRFRALTRHSSTHHSSRITLRPRLLLSLWLGIGLMAGLIALPASAEQRIAFGDYDIHYNAINSSSLPPDVAKGYKVSRAQNQGVLVISVVRKDSATPHGVTTMLNGQIRNDIGQINTLEFKEVVEGSAVYYLASFRHDNNERMTFKVDIQPEGQASSYHLNFDQVFFLN